MLVMKGSGVRVPASALGKRGRSLTGLFVGAFSVAAIAAGHALELVVLYYLPIRLAIMWLGFAFDYPPHNGLPYESTEDRFKNTRNRIGLGAGLTGTLTRHPRRFTRERSAVPNASRPSVTAAPRTP